MGSKLRYVCVLACMDMIFCAGIAYWASVSPTAASLEWPYMIVLTLVALGLAFVNLHN